MKRKCLVLTICILLIGCDSGYEGEIEKVDPSTIEPLEITSEDIVDTHGDITNLERLNEFLSNIETHQSDQVRIISYTEEGAPVLKNISFSEDLFTFTHDTRRDGFGTQIIETFTCEGMIKDETQSSIRYSLDGCTGDEEMIMVLESHS